MPQHVGACLEDQLLDPDNGDVLQHTTGGLLVRRQFDGRTAFTDGYQTWVHGPHGLAQRLNGQRFSWETNPDGLPVAEALAPAPPAPGSVYTTSGPQILDPAGRPYLMYGLNRPSLEWRADGEHLSKEDIDLMASWGTNTVRVPVNQDFLLPDSCHASANYWTTLDRLIGWITANQMNALIDLHWSDRNNPCIRKMGQQDMPDERSVLFWQQMAAHYKGNPYVFFDLYNEPRDVTWDCWLRGCTMKEGWRAVGMQQLYDTVRTAGFQNLVLIGGLNWARDLSGVPTHRVEGYGIVYATHPYYADASAASLHHDFGALTGSYPVVVGEFGPAVNGKPFCSASVMERMIAYFDAPDGNAARRVGWLAWAWYAAGDICGFPALISDWQGTPAPNGGPVKAALARYRAHPPSA